MSNQHGSYIPGSLTLSSIHLDTDIYSLDDIQTQDEFNLQTHHFWGDVGVWQVSVLAHDRKVTVHIDGQRVTSQHHNSAERKINKYTRHRFNLCC